MGELSLPLSGMRAAFSIASLYHCKLQRLCLPVSCLKSRLVRANVLALGHQPLLCNMVPTHLHRHLHG